MLRRLPCVILSLLCMVSAMAPAYCQSEPVKAQVKVDRQVQDETPGAKRKIKVGLALGGGGMRGAAHIGVLKVLQREGVPIDMIAGTSMGSVVGGLYAAGTPLQEIEERFVDRSLMKAFMTVPLTVRIVVAPILVLPRAVGHHAYDGLYTGRQFRKYLNNALPEGERQIEGLSVPFNAVALNIVDGKVYRISQGCLGCAMQASAAVPGLRKPVQIGGRLYVDGGVVANVPVEQAREMGADIVIAVNVDERVNMEPLDTFRAMGSVSKRIVKLQLEFIDAPQVKEADVVIHPDVDGIGLLSTKEADASRAIKAGEAAAEAAMPAIRKRLAEAGIACGERTAAQ